MSSDPSSLSHAHITAWIRLMRTSTRMVQAVEDALKTAGLPPLAWYDLLLELKRAEPEGLRPFQLQSAMLIPQYNMSRLLDRVVKAGYAKRHNCDDDKRGQMIRITTAGLKMQDSMWPIYRATLAENFAARLTRQEAEELARMLR